MVRPQFDQSSVPPAESDLAPLNSPSSVESSNPPVEESAPRRKKVALKIPKGFWGWQFLGLVILLGFGTTGTGALLWLLTMPPAPNCEEISPLSPDGERLYCADLAAKSGKMAQLQEAFNLVNSWPADHPLQPLAQQKMKGWVQSLISFAEEKLEAGDLNAALKVVSIVPKNTPAYDEVTAAVQGWKNNWDDGQKIYDKAQAAMKALDWSKTFQYAQALSKLNNIHWSEKRFNEIMDRLSLERKGNQRLDEARELSKEKTPDKLAEAIALANQIDKKLYIASAATKEIKTWSRGLLDQAAEQLKQKNLERSIDIANLVPSYSPLYSEAQNLMLLGQVKAVEWDQSPGESLLKQIYVLSEGKQALMQMGKNRPAYKEAQVEPEEISEQIQDLVDLQFASVMAKMQHPFSLELAIDQAQMIDPKRPRRVHAQTLVAHWRKEILRLEDQPYLALARRLAETETLDGFQTAVQQARQVLMGRPLRIQAQTLIAEWTKRIEIIEDQPLLNEALALAKQGNLSAAIDKASKIGTGRALHKQAQEKISGWVAQVQIAEDRPILDRAYNLAKQGSLSGAIAEAAQIRYGRALYSEAQGAIAGWAAERDAAIAAQQPAVETAPAAASNSYSENDGYSGDTGYSNNYSEPSNYSSDNSGDTGYSSYSQPEGYSEGYSSYSEPEGYSDGYSGDSGYSAPAYTEPEPTAAEPYVAPAEPVAAPVEAAPLPEPIAPAAPEPTASEGNPAPEAGLFLE